MADPTRTVVTSEGPPTASVADPAATTTGEPAPAGPSPPPTPARYLLGEPIARGGMGEVFRATDTTLGREVAVKVLGNKYAPGSTTARRFLDEARITGQLQHPGIPPVHDLGTLPDGRPFLAMKLIKGDTLADLLNGGRANTLAVFEGICQAVGYAHAHGVIHRDLKPANVMVGAFGEVQVMDWGLAKVLASRDRHGAVERDPDATADSDPTEIKSLRNAETQAGALLGTPAFMAPEQAIGAVDQIDRRTDVFGLGGILCSLLTGKPPFVGDTAESTRQLAARAKLADAFARLAGCGAEPDLVALAKRCLSAEKADRPADAGEVAKAVATLRAAADDRARRAENDRERAEVESREQRKRRRVMQWACGIVIGVLLAGVIGTAIGLAQASDAREREKQRADGEERAKDATARAFLKASDILDVMASEVTGESLATQRTVTPEQKRFLVEVLTHYQEFATAPAGDEAARHRAATAAARVGLIESRLGRLPEAVAAYQRSRDEFAALAADHPDAIEYRRLVAKQHGSLGMVRKRLGDTAAAEQEFKTALALFRQLPADPSRDRDVAQTHGELGGVYYTRRLWAAADSEYHLAAEVYERVVAADPNSPETRRALAALLFNRAILQADRGPGERADPLPLYARGLALFEGLAAERPGDRDARVNLAKAYGDYSTYIEGQGERPAAIDKRRAAVDQLEKLVRDYPSVPEYRDLLEGNYSRLATQLYAMRRHQEADEAVRKCQEIARALVAEFPTVAAYREGLAVSHNTRGVMRYAAYEPDAAEGEFRAAVAVFEGLVRDLPGVPNHQFNLATGYYNVAGLVAKRGAWAEADALFRKSFDLSLKMVADHPAVPQYPPHCQRIGYDYACFLATAAAKLPGGQTGALDRAIAVLQAVGGAGYSDVPRLKRDRDLDPLRGREDFQKLVADLETKFPPKREVLPAPRRE